MTESNGSKQSQILAHLQKGYTITPIQALRLFGVFRLADTVFKLKKKGYNIKTTMRAAHPTNKVTGKPERQTWAEYRLVK